MYFRFYKLKFAGVYLTAKIAVRLTLVRPISNHPVFLLPLCHSEYNRSVHLVLVSCLSCYPLKIPV